MAARGTRPSPGELFKQAGGGTPSYSREEYLRLMRLHGHVLLPEDAGYDQASRTLPCGWPGPQKPSAGWWCEKFEMPASGCAHCTGRTADEGAEGPDPAGFGSWFAARLHDLCSGCPEPVRPGDRIRADGESGYLCETCGGGSL